ncbi:Holliday junction resolvase RuvX [Endothiovibrio diazotrophicus]
MQNSDELMTVDPASGTVLGFDFGLKRIGVAVGQGVTATAAPLTTLKAVNGKTDWAGIERLLAEWRPVLVVVGLPLNMDGSEQELTRAARNFGRRLEGRFHRPVAFVDERLSSVEARERLAGRVRDWHRAEQAGTVDREAAQIILQSWFDQRERAV